MSGLTPYQYGDSVLPRPSYLHRERSNSLPPNSFLASATEVGMMFSAAERATARRKKTYSVDYSSLPGTPFETFLESNQFPTPPSYNVQKPSPLRQVNTIKHISTTQISPPSPEATPITEEKPCTPTNKSSQLSIDLPDSLLQQLPVSPLSPKRQVVSPSLKSYADSLLQFTHSRLISAVPAVPAVHVSTPVQPSGFFDNPTPSNSLRPSRPAFVSKFSDWSTTNNSAYPTPHEGFPGLMSPDAFFGVQESPINYFESQISGYSFPSSETYDAAESNMPPTPPLDDQEISYFTNFDRFLDSSNWQAPRPGNDSPLGSVVIDLSPLGPGTPSEQVLKSISEGQERQRSSTSATIRHFASSAPLLSAGMAPCSISPMASVHLAEMAVRVPGCWIGAV